MTVRRICARTSASVYPSQHRVLRDAARRSSARMQDSRITAKRMGCWRIEDSRKSYQQMTLAEKIWLSIIWRRQWPKLLWMRGYISKQQAREVVGVGDKFLV